MIRALAASHVDADGDAASAISIVVVDPRFDAYKSLATAARMGLCSLHFRPSGSAALQLLSRRRAEAVVVGEELDDMAGHEFVALLRAQQGNAPPGAATPVVLMAAAAGGLLPAAGPARPVGGCDATLSHPITTRDVQEQVWMRFRRGGGAGRFATLQRVMATFPVGVSVAAVVIAAMLLR